MNFDGYRNKNGYSQKSIRVQNSHINRFKTWCMVNSINPETITYGEVLRFIDSERQRGISNPTITREINTIRIYFDCLVSSGVTGSNVIRRVKIRQGGTRALPQTLTAQQLETIYRNFANLPAWEHRTRSAKELHKRNIVVLGLLIYQGLTSDDTAKLETCHVSLTEGKIYIPSTRKRNFRTLKLQANQILPLKTYIEENAPYPYLFPTRKHTDMISKIIRQAKKQNPEIIDSRHIRTSVIMEWLKSNRIRQVQYMAGHRNIRTTEQYRSGDLTDLARQLELFHPMQ